MEGKNNDTLFIGLGVAAVLAALYYKYGKSSTTTVATTVASPYVTQAMLDALSNTPHQAYREPAADEWSSMCGTWTDALGFPVCLASSGLTSDRVLGFFKGYNIDPVHDQGLAHNFAADIMAYHAAAPIRDRSRIAQGSFLTATGISGINSCMSCYR